PNDPLEESEANHMFWCVGRNVPSRLLLLDTPDVDSDVAVNWARARSIRQVSDVLIAVLTQQKYNDAAVKQFFREAAAADKPILVVFNQCDLEEDAHYWPQWLDTFMAQTDTQPERVYVVPADRKAAGKLELPFYEVGPDGRRPIGETANLRDDLASLHFDAIKIRTFRGAMARLVDPANGVGAYLASIRSASDDFSTAAKALSAREMARVAWPALPATILVDEVRAWWDSDRAEWSRRVHGFYRQLGQGVTWPIRAAREAFGSGAADPLETLYRQERQAIVAAVENLLNELERLAEVGNDTLRPRLAKLLGGDSRQKLLEDVRAAHEELPAVDSDYRKFLREELDGWQEANPRVVKFLRSLDHVAAVARPALTVSLAVSGWVVAGDLVGQAAMQAVGQTAGGLATEAAIAGGITGGGEAIVSTTTEGVRQAAVKLLGRLQARYAHQRAEWLAEWLEKSLLGDLLEELRLGAEAENCEAFRGAEEALGKIRAMCS
ncbi:MAG: GTPase domain-containing protein, partial [Chloroflexota bacterium]|nr:GTPase domain-containing protein [Chloroflexota bacterium]